MKLVRQFPLTGFLPVCWLIRPFGLVREFQMRLLNGFGGGEIEMDDDVKPRPAATWTSIEHCTENMLPRKDRTRGIQYRRQFRPTLCGDLQSWANLMRSVKVSQS